LIDQQVLSSAAVFWTTAAVSVPFRICCVQRWGCFVVIGLVAQSRGIVGEECAGDQFSRRHAPHVLHADELSEIMRAPSSALAPSAHTQTAASDIVDTQSGGSVDQPTRLKINYCSSGSTVNLVKKVAVLGWV
jgi:hypothetical protein